MLLFTSSGKQSIVLDLKQPEGLAAFNRLVAKADVLVSNFRPGVMERLKVGPEDLKKINPALVYVRYVTNRRQPTPTDRPTNVHFWLCFPFMLGRARVASGCQSRTAMHRDTPCLLRDCTAMLLHTFKYAACSADWAPPLWPLT